MIKQIKVIMVAMIAGMKLKNHMKMTKMKAMIAGMELKNHMKMKAMIEGMELKNHMKMKNRNILQKRFNIKETIIDLN